MVLMFGIVLVLIGWAQNPANWRWFDIFTTPPQGPSPVTLIDNRLDVQTQRDSLPKDTFLMPGKPRPPRSGIDDAYFPGVTAEQFEAVRDDAPSRRDEQAVSLHLFDILNRADPQSLQKWSLGPITYAQLFQQPNLYRGRLVSVSGIVRRVNWLDLSPNDYGIKGYYQVWLWPTDNPSAPIVIYCLDLPEGFPSGMEIAEQAEVTGFFFKRWAYQAKDAIRTAPEILAKTLHWDKRLVMNPKEPAETWPIPLVVCAAVLASLVAAYIVYLRTRPPRPILPDQSPDFDRLQECKPEEGTTDEHG